MNYYFLVAGIISLSATIGHFVMGTPDFLKLVLKADIDVIPKKVMHGLFHYLSIILILTNVTFLLFAFGETMVFHDTSDIPLFIGVMYAGLALIQLIIALISSIDKGVLKLFQWISWSLIALFAFLGS